MTTLHFIHQSSSEDLASTKRRRRMVRSTAARAGHIESRRSQSSQSRRNETPRGRSQPEVLASQSDKAATPGLVAILQAGRRDPFMSFARPFQPNEDFLLDHFVKAIVPLMRCNDEPKYYVERMTNAWVPLALSDTGLLSSLFLTACRHLAANTEQEQQQEYYARLALQYKLVCVRSIMAAISSNVGFSDATIAETVMLAYDELGVGDAAISKHHIDGAVRMVRLNGGPRAGLDGLLEHLISNLLFKFQDGLYKPPEPRVIEDREPTCAA